MLDRLDPLVQRLGGVAGADGDALLAQDRPRVDPFVDEEELRRVFNLGIGYCAVVPEAGDGLVIGELR